MPTYGIHPSNELVELFKGKPYQGANPEKAKIIILGNDANYSPEISSHPFFKYILEYHEDGVEFWNRYDVHHPFLLENYPFNKTSGGVPYHRKFGNLKFSSDHAKYISFVELLDIPTIGNTGSDINLFFNLIKPSHIKWLEEIIYAKHKKIVIVNQTLMKYVFEINKRTEFLKAFKSDVYNMPTTRVIKINDYLTLYNGYSFSASHCSNKYLENLSFLLHDFIEIKYE